MGRVVKLIWIGVFAYSKSSGRGMKLSTITAYPFCYAHNTTDSSLFISCAVIHQEFWHEV